MRDHPLLINFAGANVSQTAPTLFAECEPLAQLTVAVRWSVGHDHGFLNRAPSRHQVNDQNNHCYNQQEMYHPATNVTQESE